MTNVEKIKRLKKKIPMDQEEKDTIRQEIKHLESSPENVESKVLCVEEVKEVEKVVEEPKEEVKPVIKEVKQTVGKRGRKALEGTHEGRDFIVSDKFDNWIDSCPISKDGKARIKKAVMFGLGVKDYTKENDKKVLQFNNS